MSTAALRRLDQRLAAPMLMASMTSLLCLAVLLHFHVRTEDGLERPEFRPIWLASLAVSLSVWPLYLVELSAAWWFGSPRLRERLVCCLLPPMRFAARDHETGRRIWFPGWGWQTVNQELQHRLQAVSNLPMIIVACLVLPLIAIEHYFATEIEQNIRWSACVAAATTLIWLAFTLEFVVMCSVSERKLQYCKEHWLDLVIILLPLVAFLRALRLGRLLRLNQLTQLPKAARMYRMKGVSLRAWKALLVLDIVKRLTLGGPAQRLAQIEKQIAQKEDELAALRAEQVFLQRQLETPVEPYQNAA